MSDKAKRTKNIINRILAISVAVAMIPVKPRRPAIIATTKNVRAHTSIPVPPLSFITLLFLL